MVNRKSSKTSEKQGMNRTGRDAEMLNEASLSVATEQAAWAGTAHSNAAHTVTVSRRGKR